MTTTSTTSVGSSFTSADGSLFNVSGLASGLNTDEIITELMSIAREPVVRLTHEQTKLNAQQQQLTTIQTSLRQLSQAAFELGSPVLFDTVQTISSSDPTEVSATATAGGGAAVGGYELQVSQLASAAQRTFSFLSPTSDQTLTIDGHPFTIAAGESAGGLAAAINADPTATVYAAATNSETIVLSDRATGDTGSGFIEVADPGGSLSEVAGKAKQGQNAEYTLDGVAASSTANTLTGAVAGVTLELKALTTGTGPVTIDVAPPAPSTSAIATQVKSFVELYDSTIGAIQTQLTTKPPAKPHSAPARCSATPSSRRCSTSCASRSTRRSPACPRACRASPRSASAPALRPAAPPRRPRSKAI
jgi:flagellar hook-associated protein 2